MTSCVIFLVQELVFQGELDNMLVCFSLISHLDHTSPAEAVIEIDIF